MALKKIVFSGIPKKVERISDAREFTVRYGVNNKENTELSYLVVECVDIKESYDLVKTNDRWKSRFSNVTFREID